MLNSIINYIFEPDTQKKLAEYAIIIGLLLLLTTIFILTNTPVVIFIILIQLIFVFLAFKHSNYILNSKEIYYSIVIGAIFFIIIICNIISIAFSHNNPFRIFMLILDMIIMILYLFLFFYANNERCNNTINKKYNMFCKFFQNVSTTSKKET